MYNVYIYLQVKCNSDKRMKDFIKLPLYVVLLTCLPYTTKAQKDSVNKKYPKITLIYKYHLYTRKHVKVVDSSLSGACFINVADTIFSYDVAVHNTRILAYMKTSKGAYKCFRRSMNMETFKTIPMCLMFISGFTSVGAYLIDGGAEPLAHPPVSPHIVVVTYATMLGMAGITYLCNRLERASFINAVKIYNHDNGYL
jgi:hypothetical protein